MRILIILDELLFTHLVTATILLNNVMMVLVVVINYFKDDIIRINIMIK